MQKFLIALFSLLNILALQAQTPAVRKDITIKQSKAVKGKDHIPGVIIFKLKESGVSAKSLSINPKFNLKSASIMSMERKFPESRHSDKVQALGRIKNPGLERIYQIKISSDAQMDAVIKELLEDPRVEYAEPKYIHHRNFLPSTVNDPLQQSYLTRVMAPQAWALFNTPGIEVIIGIVDSGSELDHEDLSDNIYSGWDLVGSDKDNFIEDNDPNVKDSLYDHGVHVSGLASAVTNNTKGVASIAYNHAKLLIVKAAADNDQENIYQGYEGIKYAADMGANIINCSWGSPGGGSFGRDIINYAMSKNCLIVAAAGNDGENGNEPVYPAAYQGVIAVANTDNNDIKDPSSTYGGFVTLSAPGVSIISTKFRNSYGPKTGTSMSAPIVSSAAALVKSFYGARFNMQQVGEILRITADNIDHINPAFKGKLGKGRVNVYHALQVLTNKPPSVRIQNITRVDKAAANVVQPDTLYLYFDVKNFLFNVSNLQLTLRTTNPNATIINSSSPVTIDLLRELETHAQIGPFKVAIRPETPSNTLVDFQLNFSSGNYQDYDNFSSIVAQNYFDIITPSITTTITSNGRIGYSAPDKIGGSGFQYKANDLLYEASLMIGNAADRVSNNARAKNGSNEHFVKIERAHEAVNNADSTVAKAEFDDRNAKTKRLNIAVKQQMIGYKMAPNDKYVISEYEVRNTSNTELKDVYVGLFTDWDIAGGSKNVTEYDSFNRLAYTYDKSAGSNYAGVKLLSTNASPVYYPLSYELSEDPLSDDDFTIAEKWETLSNGVKSNGLGITGQGLDVSSVSGNGPYRIPAHGSVKVTFALLAGDNLADLKVSAQAAQQKYNRILEQNRLYTQVEFEVYPNPLVTSQKSSNTILFNLPEDGFVTLDFYNLLGQKIKSLVTNQYYNAGSYSISENFMVGNLIDISTGVFLYRLVFNGQVKTRKIMVLR